MPSPLSPRGETAAACTPRRSVFMGRRECAAFRPVAKIFIKRPRPAAGQFNNKQRASDNLRAADPEMIQILNQPGKTRRAACIMDRGRNNTVFERATDNVVVISLFFGTYLFFFYFFFDFSI